MEIIKDLNESCKFNDPMKGDFFYSFVNEKCKKMNESNRLTFIDENLRISSELVSPIENKGVRTGLVIGYVQSGKTMSFTAQIALAIDSGFRAGIVFAGIGNNLLDQTYLRLKKDLNVTSPKFRSRINVFKNPTHKDIPEIRNALVHNKKPFILIVVLKHSMYIKELSNIFSSTLIKREVFPSIIIDDEADQYSLNTYNYKNFKNEENHEHMEEFSSTYESILRLRNQIPNHTYLQYTATPQSNVLQGLCDVLRPEFPVVITPGDGYVGGLHYFHRDNVNNRIVEVPDGDIYVKSKQELEFLPESLKNAIDYYLLTTAYLVFDKSEIGFTSMLVHPHREIKILKLYSKWIKNDLNAMFMGMNSAVDDPFFNTVKKRLSDTFHANSSDFNGASFMSLFNIILDEISASYAIKEVFSNLNDTIVWEDNTANILIGADKLNRGFTVENLTVSYLTRTNQSKSNSDTLQQRARFFGYKKGYFNQTKIYLTSKDINDFNEYVRFEEDLRSKLKVMSVYDFVNSNYFKLSPTMNLTRKNVIPVNLKRTQLDGWIQFRTYNLNNNGVLNFDDIINLFSKYKNNVKVHEYSKNSEGDGRIHHEIRINSEDFLNFFMKLNVSFSIESVKLKQAILDIVYENKDKSFSIFLMSSMLHGVYRERSVDDSSDTGELIRVKNLQSGGTVNYPGDKMILNLSSFVNLQLYYVKAKPNEKIKFELPSVIMASIKLSQSNSILISKHEYQ